MDIHHTQRLVDSSLFWYMGSVKLYTTCPGGGLGEGGVGWGVGE